MNGQQDPPEQKATEQPQQTEAAVPEPEPVAEAAPEAAEPDTSRETIEAEAEAPPAEEETEQPEAPPEPSAEQAEAGRAPGKQRCRAWMYVVPGCGRPIHHAPAGVDEEPVCLMHSKDPAKSDKEFQKEFERILAEAGDGVADFRGFVFPRAAYSKRTFAARCIFLGAAFTQDAMFYKAAFAQAAEFDWAAFTQGANFVGATFTRAAGFIEATFTEGADFSGATFTRDAHFNQSTFTQDAVFREATFSKDARFIAAAFTQAADFSGATFAAAADFSHAVFSGAARFAPSAGSGGEEAKPCEFKNRVLFQDARFQDYADFRGPVFGERGSSTARPVFSLARFERPERVTFYKTRLGQTLFVNCDVSKLNFSDVEWGRDGERVRLYEETVALDDEAAEPLRPPGGSRDERRYRLIAETYHQLKNNYDSSGDPWTANDFHYGEMEMLRRSSPFHNRWARWLHQNLGMSALYKYASEYGLSRGRPPAWLFLALVVFTIALLCCGLRPVPGRAAARLASLPQVSGQPGTGEELSYSRYIRFGIRDQTGRETGAGSLFLDGFATVVGIALLQRDLPYEPATRFGRLLAYTELALTSTLAALFILAVRRQFKRGGD
jgi:uncharacterized protein YjbI with pentapeptide repeats